MHSEDPWKLVTLLIIFFLFKFEDIGVNGFKKKYRFQSCKKANLMIYMVEMNLIDRSRRIDWDSWYINHTKMLLSFEGFHATQRFECIHEAKAPFVALHHVDGADFFDSSDYKDNAGPAGTGEWRRKMNNWSRNLFEGLESTPNVGDSEYLLLMEDSVDLYKFDSFRLVWLRSVGLDKDVSQRGIGCTESHDLALELAKTDGIRVLRPVNKRITKVDLLM